MKCRTSFLRHAVCCSLLLAVSSGAQEHEGHHTWDYSEARGPRHWGELTPEFAPCKLGHHQSPIDIRNAKKADLPAIRFDYKPSPLHIVDNGHTVMVNYAPGSSITVGEKKYWLKQFHFHRPSEEKLNGKSFEMEIHFVHADDEGKLVVVAVLLERGDENRLMRELWADLPKEKDRESLLNDIHIDAAELLPTDRSYFTFVGSLTTPPCSEDVTWFVLKEPVAVSASEIEQFSKLYRNDARPTQPLYERVVLESK